MNQAILYGIEMIPSSDVKRNIRRKNIQKFNIHDTQIVREKGDLYLNLYIHHSQDNVQEQIMNQKRQGNYFNNFVIKINSTWKASFDIMMLFVSTYNTFTQAYFAAFHVGDEGMVN